MSETASKYAIFYIALLVLGVTIGAIHGLSLSPVSSGILEILGAIAAASGALIFGLSKPGSINLAPDLAVKAFAATVLAIIVGYWLGWASAKYWRISHDAIPEFKTLRPDHRVDAYRLIALGEALGIPKDASVARIDQILSSNGAATRKRLSQSEEIISIQALTRVATNCQSQNASTSSSKKPSKNAQHTLEQIAQLSSDANATWALFEMQDSWFKEYKKLSLRVRSIPLPNDIHSFANFFAQEENCATKIQEKDLRLIELLDYSSNPLAQNLQDEIDRLMTMASALQSDIFQGPRIENESMSK